LAWLLAFLQVIWHFSLIRDRTREGCFQAFRQNHWLAATLCLGVMVSYALK
jgi:4-hydroxybenzoate polyprenyltransferase